MSGCDTCHWAEYHGGMHGLPDMEQAPEPGYYVCVFDRSVILLDCDTPENMVCWMPKLEEELTNE